MSHRVPPAPLLAFGLLVACHVAPAPQPDAGPDAGRPAGDAGDLGDAALDGALDDGATPDGGGPNDPCASGSHACASSATCLPGGSSYVCVCETVSFVKMSFADPSVVQDCIEPDVCITRGDTQSIYNAAVETQAEAGPGGSAPAGTRWKRGTCAGAAVEEFGTFLGPSFTNMSPPSLVGQEGCLLLPAYGDRYHVVLRSWSGGGPGGDFAYDRARVVPDGVDCPGS